MFSHVGTIIVSLFHHCVHAIYVIMEIYKDFMKHGNRKAMLSLQYIEAYNQSRLLIMKVYISTS